MNDEIKEIKHRLQLLHAECNPKAREEDINYTLDYITNLQQQLHQASLDIQELTERDIECPSWCDKLTNLQQENEELNKNQRYYKNGVFSLEYDKETLSDMVDDYKSRCDKAIEKLKTANVDIDSVRLCETIEHAIYILQNGSDDNE